MGHLNYVFQHPKMAISLANSITLPTNKRVLHQENSPLYTGSAEKNIFKGLKN